MLKFYTFLVTGLGSLLFLSSPSIAQNSYRTGFIITGKNDTLKGLVSFKDNFSKHKVCYFKESASSSPREYTPQELNAYGIDGEQRFETYTVPIDSSTLERAFLEVLTAGKIDLFYVNHVFYFRKDSSELIEFKQYIKKVFIKEKGFTYDLFLNTNEEIFRSYLKECPSINLPKGSLKYYKQYLTNVVSKYNSCFPEEGNYISVAKKPWSKFNFGVTGSYTSSSIKFNELQESDLRHQTKLHHTTFAPSKGINFGIYSELSSPRIKENFFLHIEILYGKHHYVGHYLEESLYYTDKYDVEIKYTSIKVPVLLKYNFRLKGIKPYITGGLMNYWIFNPSSLILYERELYTNARYTERYSDIRIISYFGFAAGAGISKTFLKNYNLFLEARYDTGNRITELGPKGSVSNLSFFVGLGF